MAPEDWEGILPRLGRLAAAHPQDADLAFCYGAALFRSELAKGPEGFLVRAQAFWRRQLHCVRLPGGATGIRGAVCGAERGSKAVDEYLEAIREDPKSDVATIVWARFIAR